MAGAQPPPPFQEPSFSLHVRTYGPDESLAARLIEEAAAWDQAGRPGVDTLRVRAYGASAAIATAPGEVRIDGQLSTIVVGWEGV